MINKLLKDLKLYEGTLEKLKKVKRVKTKSGKDFKILSRNFEPCHMYTDYFGKYLHFDGFDIGGLSGTETADDIEKDIQEWILSVEKDIETIKGKLNKFS